MFVLLETLRLLDERTRREWHSRPKAPPAQPDEARAPGLGAVVVGWVSRAATAIRRSNERRQMVKMLSALDDHSLADIGLTRGQIPEVAQGIVNRGPVGASCPVSPTPLVRYDAVASDEIANQNETRRAA